MAVVKIWPIRRTVGKALKYIQNEEKTKENILVKGLRCSPTIANQQFNKTKELFRKPGGNLAYHMYQSFKPGETDYKTAHKIGIELAEKVLQGKYKAVVAKHVDKDHLHNHIIFNSVSDINGKKYNDCKTTYNRIRNISDGLCMQYGLSIVTPKNKAMKYKEWLELKQGNSWKQIIKEDINKIILESKNYNEFTQKMKKQGYEIKEGKYISFRKKGYKRFVRGKTLGFDYTRDSINARIEMGRMGFHISVFKLGEKKYKVKNLRNKKFYFKNKSMLEINIQLGIRIISLFLNKNTEVKSKRQKYIKKYNKTLIEKLSQQLKIIDDCEIDGIGSLKRELKSNEEKLLKTRNDLKDKDKEINELAETVKIIDIFEKNEKYKKKKIFGNNELERRAFTAAKNKLDIKGIKEKADMERIKSKYKVEL